MNKFPIPPEYGLILNAFNQTATLRAAAALLETDPASLVRKAQMISHNYGYLEKVGNRWIVTDSGQRIAQWTDDFINSQKALLLEKSRFRIAAFSWLAEEVLIPNFKRLEQQAGSQYEWSYKILLSDLEQEIIQSRSDYVISGYAPTDPTIAYKKISNHPWIVIIPTQWKKQTAGLSSDKLIQFLQTKPYIRMTTLAPEQVLGFKPDRHANLSVDGVIGVRAAVASGLGWGHVPAMSARSSLLENKIVSLKLPTLMKDEVSLWWLRARKDTATQVKNLVKWISEFEM